MPAGYHPNLTALDVFIIDKARAFRHEMNMSQTALGIEMGLDPSFIGNIESKKSKDKYNINHVQRLAYIFNRSLCDFIPHFPLMEDINNPPAASKKAGKKSAKISKSSRKSPPGKSKKPNK
ncbi:helix-turn-helix transcriptional regulator [Flavihumibacter petaseus]|uniref:helix-turn-helix transcriptional regulator n=1 Tax=Flavihumibacter petaseus TaxID=549295 RepID=UPI00069BAF2E|nr:helix-turn-helix transcriptional regulator [Flavihumibacter petaseus]